MPDLERLEDLEFYPEVIADFSELEDLVSPEDLERAKEEADKRFRSFVEGEVLTKGVELTSFQREEALKKLRAWAYLDAYVDAALDYFGIKGDVRRDYQRVAHDAARLLRKHAHGAWSEEWPRYLYGFYGKWINFGSLDPRIVKIILMLTAKVCYQICFGKLRPPEPSKRELYPELVRGV